MKKLIILSSTLIAGLTLAACNGGGGGGSSGSQVSLPAGNYLGTMTNITPAGCVDNESGIYVSNGTGSICSGDFCTNLNLSANPCLSVTQTNSGITVTEQWQNCSYAGTTLTATMNASISQGGQSYTCSANIQLVQMAQ